eukprot:gene83-2345_t
MGNNASGGKGKTAKLPGQQSKKKQEQAKLDAAAKTGLLSLQGLHMDTIPSKTQQKQPCFASKAFEVAGSNRNLYCTFTATHGFVDLLEFPALVCGQPQLKNLDLGYNRIPDLARLAGPPTLEVLDCSNNRIQFVPPILTLPKLTKLDLSCNQLARLPDAFFSECVCLQQTSIEPSCQVSLQKNSLCELPSSLFKLARLHTLDLSGNCALAIVAPADANMGDLAALKLLDISGCSIQSLPSSLFTDTPLSKLE